MEYHENPEESREENEEEKKEEFSFMQETIKDENVGYRKIRNMVLRYAGLGLIFGLAACLGFYALRPWAEDRFSSNPRKITIPEEEEEETQEGEEGQTEETSPVLTVDDYEELNQALVTVAGTVNRSMAEISVQVSQPEGQDQALVDEDSVAGVIFEDNGVELLVAAKSLAVPEGGSLQARLVDGNSYSVSVKRQDTNLGIAVYAIAKNTLSENAWNQIQTVALGSSGSVSKGDPVIAIGSPFGYYGGMGIGVVSSTRETVSRADGDYSLLCTDIGGSTSGTGILLNTDGQIIGLCITEIDDDDNTPSTNPSTRVRVVSFSAANRTIILDADDQDNAGNDGVNIKTAVQEYLYEQGYSWTQWNTDSDPWTVEAVDMNSPQSTPLTFTVDWDE